jgi:hypothetical protein
VTILYESNVISSVEANKIHQEWISSGKLGGVFEEIEDDQKPEDLKGKVVYVLKSLEVYNSEAPNRKAKVDAWKKEQALRDAERQKELDLMYTARSDYWREYSIALMEDNIREVIQTGKTELIAPKEQTYSGGEEDVMPFEEYLELFLSVTLGRMTFLIENKYHTMIEVRQYGSTLYLADPDVYPENVVVSIVPEAQEEYHDTEWEEEVFGRGSDRMDCLCRGANHCIMCNPNKFI